MGQVTVHAPRRWPRWVVDADAIQRACEAEGIEQAIEVWVATWMDRGGYYYFDDLHKHIIVIGRHEGRHAASRTIWHELAHAWQLEVLYLCRRDAFLLGTEGGGSWLEAQAKRWEARHNEQPLTIRRKLWRR